MKKLYKFYLLLSFIGIIFIIRLFYIQIYTDKYILNAFNTSIKQEVIIPDRGFIFDRNQKLLVFNKPIYELVVIPMLVKKNFNVTEFCNILGIEKNVFFENLKKAKSYSRYLPSSFVPFISKEKFASIQEKLYKFRGFDWIKRSIRDYKVDSSTNVLGYIGEVSKKDLSQKSKYYQMGDFIGWSGVEKSYEKSLRGKKGMKYWLRDRNGTIMDSYNYGKNNIKAVSGNDVSLTIDWDLQKYAETLMFQKKGGLVAINPKNGEILSLVSSPMSNPNSFVGKHRSKEFKKLLKNEDNPLLDRTIQARYPPASTFKLITELAGLKMGVINENTRFTCYHGFKYGKKRIRCKSGNHHGRSIDVKTAIAVSCNNYFAQVYKKIVEKYPKNLTRGINEWNDIIGSFGFDHNFNNDLVAREKGFIPSGDYYNKVYGNNKWNSITIISNSIGQGEISVTPLQLANLASCIANKGYFYTPHIVKKINNQINYKFNKKINYTKVRNKKYYNLVIKGMEKVFMIGTGKHFRYSNIRMAGKTGTSQNFFQINKKMISLPDHSIFILFAPVKNPKIAIAVIIENGGFGSRIAGPIASLIAEKYINHKVSRKNLEKKIMKLSLRKTYNSISRLKKLRKFYIYRKKTINH